MTPEPTPGEGHPAPKPHGGEAAGGGGGVRIDTGDRREAGRAWTAGYNVGVGVGQDAERRMVVAYLKDWARQAGNGYDAACFSAAAQAIEEGRHDGD